MALSPNCIKLYFSEAESFFLVGWSQLQCFSPVPMGKNFLAISACDFFFVYFFGHSIWLRAMEHCTSVPWLCECWCDHTWECFKSPDAPFGDVACGTLGMFPVVGRMPSILQSILIQNGAVGVSGDLKHSQVWLYQHSESHGTWLKKYAQKNAGWNIFYSRDLIEAL